MKLIDLIKKKIVKIGGNSIVRLTNVIWVYSIIDFGS